MVEIKRCLCFDQQFADLKDIAHKTGSKTVHELQNHVDFGMNCQLCHPYVKRMLESGETVFNEVIVENS